jgi:hypothetical protein
METKDERMPLCIHFTSKILTIMKTGLPGLFDILKDVFGDEEKTTPPIVSGKDLLKRPPSKIRPVSGIDTTGPDNTPPSSPPPSSGDDGE